MIEQITLRKFKRFRDRTIPLFTPGVSLIAGANNSGKSSILHALAIWEFCRTIIEVEKGFKAFLPGARAQGLGVADDEFSPILVPSLNHLWTNLASQKKNQVKMKMVTRLEFVRHGEIAPTRFVNSSLGWPSPMTECSFGPPVQL